jgi:CBS domain-containing protein
MKVVPLHDDLFDFFYEALPGYEEVGRRRAVLGCWGSFQNPWVCDYNHRTMNEWVKAMYVTPGIAFRRATAAYLLKFFWSARLAKPIFGKTPQKKEGMMEITTTIGSILNRKGSSVWSVSPSNTVFEAISMMAEKNVGALPVMEAGRLVGMISERDYARKVILLGRGSRETTVADIMTSNVRTVRLNDSVQACLQLMTENRIRHLPVIEEGELTGIISIGDCVNWIISAQTAAIDDLERFVTGAYPG